MSNSILFINLTERYMPLIYLTLLDDFDAIPIYSWGSIVLACLYRHLCLERGQIGWRMFVTSTCMNGRI
jgi:hypothetical protein